MSDWDRELKKEEQTFNYFWNGLKNFWQLLGPEQRRVTWVIVFTFIGQVFALSFPYLIKLFFDELPAILETNILSNYLIFIIGLMFVFQIIRLVFLHFVKEKQFLKSLLFLENWWPVMAQKKLLALSFGYHEKENIGKKISKIEKGCHRLVNVMLDFSWSLLPHLFYLIINIIIILIIDWKIGLLFFLPFIPVLWINKKFYQRFSDDWSKWDKMKEKSSGYFCQSLLNVKTVQSFVQEKKEIKLFERVRQEMNDLDLEINLKEQKYFFGIGLILHGCFVLTVVLGVVFILKGWSSLGTVIYIIIAGNMTIGAISEMFHVYVRIMRYLVSVERMKELMDTEVDIKNSDKAIIPKSFQGNFEFKNVEFIYPGKEEAVLKDFSLNFSAQEMIALVGKSGEGKTTVIKLLTRMYDISKGQILLDGCIISSLDLFWLRKLFAVVQQDVEIFDSSLQQNITYPFSKASEKQIKESIEAAHLQVMVNDKKRFPNGLKTQVGERGVRLSGGEKQRVGIARAYIALLNGAKVLILDEATSSLDSEAERAIQNMINNIRRKLNISIVAIAHRLSIIQKADRIYVINNGQVVEKGNHQRLLSKNGLYSKLVELQKLGDLRE